VVAAILTLTLRILPLPALTDKELKDPYFMYELSKPGTSYKAGTRTHVDHVDKERRTVVNHIDFDDDYIKNVISPQYQDRIRELNQQSSSSSLYNFITMFNRLGFEREKLDAICGDAYKTYADFLFREDIKQSGIMSDEVYKLYQKAKEKYDVAKQAKTGEIQTRYFNYTASAKASLIEIDLNIAKYYPNSKIPSEEKINLENIEKDINDFIFDTWEGEERKYFSKYSGISRYWLLGRILQAKAQLYKLKKDDKNYYLLSKLIASAILNKENNDLSKIIQENEFSILFPTLKERITGYEEEENKLENEIKSNEEEINKLEEEIRSINKELDEIKDKILYKLRPEDKTLLQSEEPEPTPQPQPEPEEKKEEKPKSSFQKVLKYFQSDPKDVERTKKIMSYPFRKIKELVNSGRLVLSDKEKKRLDKLELQEDEKYSRIRFLESQCLQNKKLLFSIDSKAGWAKEAIDHFAEESLFIRVNKNYKWGELEEGIHAQPLTSLRYAELLKGEAARLKKEVKTKNDLGETREELLREAKKHFQSPSEHPNLQFPALVGLMELNFENKDYLSIVGTGRRFKEIIGEESLLNKQIIDVPINALKVRGYLVVSGANSKLGEETDGKNYYETSLRMLEEAAKLKEFLPESITKTDVELWTIGALKGLERFDEAISRLEDLSKTPNLDPKYPPQINLSFAEAYLGKANQLKEKKAGKNEYGKYFELAKVGIDKIILPEGELSEELKDIPLRREFVRGYIELGFENYKIALNQFQKIESDAFGTLKDKQKIEVKIALVDCYKGLKDFKGAEKILNEMLKILESSPLEKKYIIVSKISLIETYLGRANQIKEDGETKDDLEYFAQAGVSEKDFETYFFTKAKEEINKIVLTEGELSDKYKMLRLRKEFAQGYIDLGLENYQAALYQFQKIEKGDFDILDEKQKIDIKLAQADCYKGLKNYREAIQILTSFTVGEKDEQHIKAKVSLAEAYLGNAEVVKSDYLKGRGIASTLNPDDEKLKRRADFVTAYALMGMAGYLDDETNYLEDAYQENEAEFKAAMGGFSKKGYESAVAKFDDILFTNKASGEEKILPAKVKAEAQIGKADAQKVLAIWLFELGNFKDAFKQFAESKETFQGTERVCNENTFKNENKLLARIYLGKAENLARQANFMELRNEKKYGKSINDFRNEALELASDAEAIVNNFEDQKDKRNSLLRIASIYSDCEKFNKARETYADANKQCEEDSQEKFRIEVRTAKVLSAQAGENEERKERSGKKKFLESAEIYEDLLNEKYANSPRLMLERARNLAWAGRNEESQAAYEKNIQTASEAFNVFKPRAQYELAQVYFNYGWYNEALEEYRKVKERVNNNDYFETNGMGDLYVLTENVGNFKTVLCSH
jgi:hypothetical protein